MDTSIGEALEKDRVERILADLRENHNNPEYRRAVLVDLFLAGRLEPVNGYIH